MKYPDLGINISEFKKILVLGNSEAALCLYNRLKELIENDQSVDLSRSAVKEPFDLVFDVDRPDGLQLRDYDYALYLQVSWQYCMGLTPARQLLRDTDWQALRDLERSILAMNADGLVNLPINTLNLFRLRESMRSETNTEPDYVA